MIWVLLHLALVTACMLRILLRPHRQPESRLAWLVVVMVLPYAGVLAYLLLGETSIGRKRVERIRAILAGLPRPEQTEGWPDASVSGPYEPLFNVGTSISGYGPVGGNQATLMADSDAAIDAMVADVDAATDHVHLMFYIWLADDNGTKMAKALMRAARRGVTCRAMVDDLGSRDLVRSPLWQEMTQAGVKTATALKIGNPLLRILDGRIDLRDHRKILVIDNRVTYCGSQNCADPAFLPKAKYAPWVDVVMRFEGPVVRQNQHLFASDWIGNGGDDVIAVLREPMTDKPAQAGFPAQVIGTGPTVRNSAMPEMFQSLMFAARRELIITTPYYVPNAALQAALCAAANRGVDTTVIFPARNDDFAVGATCRSYYEELLSAGVRIYEFQPGLLHSKSLTLDGEVTLIGSANMDRRSFDLNYENNVLLHDAEVTAAMRGRQMEYVAQSRPVTAEDVQGWRWTTKVWNNAMAVLGPVL
ncbi:cardiolipin synthase [Seohaeicola saemankumensis]|nr:cardiolipin synthase [Seohaeicola saemankumensis]MCA0873593.1 cardiolipin synthase [Seohaeicola saemankumensis]